MRSPTRNLSLRLKIGGSIALVVLAIDLFQLIYFPARQMDALQRALERKVVSYAAFVAYEVAVGLEFDDKKTVNSAFVGASRDADYVRSVLYDRKGALYASHGKLGGEPRSLNQRRREQIALARGAGQLVVTAPVALTGGAQGTLVMTFSTSAIEQERQRIRRATALTGALILAVGLLVAYFVGTSLGRRLRRMQQTAERVASGDLSTAVAAEEAQDEIGRMSASFATMLAGFRQLQELAVRVADGDLSSTTTMRGDLAAAVNQMIAAQRKIVLQFAETAVQLNAAATEFRSSAEQQNRGAVEQSTAVEENQRTMDTLLKSASHIADTAQAVLQNAETTQSNSRLVADRIATLTAHTARISEILQSINEIANKSDLLALNAALEGTKAGEAGRGFSLVANQMQRLAENVMASVVDIKKLTTTIKEATRETVLATEETTKIAANTTRSARQIAMTIQQQQVGTEQVSRTMEDVARIAREAAAGSKQVFASSDDLVQLSRRLQSLVDRFRLEQGAATVAARHQTSSKTANDRPLGG